MNATISDQVDNANTSKSCKTEGCHFEAADDSEYCKEHKQRVEDNEDIVEILKDTMSSHEFVGAEGSVIKIVKGRCKHCGGNRLRRGHNEPAGISFTACPVCDRDNMSMQNDFEYELGAEAVE